MNKSLYNLLSKFVKILYANRITNKPYLNESTRLYYEISQHLKFLFQRNLKYEPEIQKNISSFINNGDKIFDIGANIGQYTLLFSDIVAANGEVFAIEPDFKNYSFLQFNCNINKKSNVTCLNFGLGEQEGILEYYRDTETGGRSGSFKREFVGDKFKGLKDQVNVKTLDSLLAEFGIPDFVKIDVEGFEYEVINGLTQKLNDTVFFIEVREETKLKVFDYFKIKQYKCYQIDSPIKLIQNPYDIPGFANLIFISKKNKTKIPR